MIEELLVVEPTDVTCHRELKEERVDESPEEPSKYAERWPDVVTSASIERVSVPAFHAS